MYLGIDLGTSEVKFLLLDAQHVRIPARRLTESFWVALFFNNFLPSNIGGDVVRIADTSKPAGSKTLATMVILVDRVLGLFALLSVGAIGAMGARSIGVDIPGTIWIEVGALAALAGCLLLFFAPGLLDLVLRPVRALGHPWVLERLETLQRTLARFRERPSALAGALLGAVLVQGVIVAFYALTARSLSVPLPLVMAGVLVPVALVLQMAPVSINGFGKFNVKASPEREGRNPATGEAMTIAASKTAKFKPSKTLKDQL